MAVQPNSQIEHGAASTISFVISNRRNRGGTNRTSLLPKGCPHQNAT